VAVVPKNVIFEVEISTVNLIEYWEKIAISIKLLRLSQPSTHFITMSSMKSSGLVGE
jgi:hypothetical protein